MGPHKVLNEFRRAIFSPDAGAFDGMDPVRRDGNGVGLAIDSVEKEGAPAIFENSEEDDSPVGMATNMSRRPRWVRSSMSL